MTIPFNPPYLKEGQSFQDGMTVHAKEKWVGDGGSLRPDPHCVKARAATAPSPRMSIRPADFSIALRERVQKRPSSALQLFFILSWTQNYRKRLSAARSYLIKKRKPNPNKVPADE